MPVSPLKCGAKSAARVQKLANVLPFRDTNSALAVLEVGEGAEGIQLQLENPIGMGQTGEGGEQAAWGQPSEAQFKYRNSVN
jgi:hypothetical protein